MILARIQEVAAWMSRLSMLLTGALLKRCASLLSPDWRLLLWGRQTKDTVIASIGSVEIRQVARGCLAQTWVKGDLHLARGTALLRLSKYLAGENQSHVEADGELPILQQQIAPRLWQISVRLAHIGNVHLAPMPRGRKVRVNSQEPSTWAVLRKAGRPTEQKISNAEIEIRDAIARSRWFAIGGATVRFHVPGSIIPVAGGFEVAVPVVRQDESSQIAQQEPISCPSQSPSLPVH
jgi:SOUL heme-binding protein